MDKYVDNLLSNLDNTLDFEKEVNKLGYLSKTT